jgi:hypothetical protein
MTEDHESALLAEEAVLVIVELFRNWKVAIEWCRKAGPEKLVRKHSPERLQDRAAFTTPRVPCDDPVMTNVIHHHRRADQVLSFFYASYGIAPPNLRSCRPSCRSVS